MNLRIATAAGLVDPGSGAPADGPVRVFALVRTQAALATEPGLADQLADEVLAAARRGRRCLLGADRVELRLHVCQLRLRFGLRVLR